jgi:hypothetical protein
MEVEEHDYALRGFDVAKSFPILPVDDQRPLYLRDAPVAGDLTRIRANEADRSQLDLRTDPSLSSRCLLATTSQIEHTRGLRESNRRCSVDFHTASAVIAGV